MYLKIDIEYLNYLINNKIICMYYVKYDSVSMGYIIREY